MHTSCARLLAVLILAALACGEAACASDAPAGDATSSALVDQIGDLPDEDLPNDLGADPEPMASDDEIDALAARPDAVQEAEAEADLLAIEAETKELTGAAETITSASAKTKTKAAPKPRCRKRIHVTFAVYTYMTSQLGDNGCWIPEDTVADKNVRDCHSNGDVVHPNGDQWFYDDTNPYNPLSHEEHTIASCAKGESRGYEYMAFRDDRWRLVTEKHVAAYFAELYTDDAHIDDLYYEPGVFRGNRTLKAHVRSAPMLNFGPYPDGQYSQHEIGREILKVCKTVKNHGYLGLYEWHYPLHAGDARVKTLGHALDACTRRR